MFKLFIHLLTAIRLLAIIRDILTPFGLLGLLAMVYPMLNGGLGAVCFGFGIWGTYRWILEAADQAKTLYWYVGNKTFVRITNQSAHNLPDDWDESDDEINQLLDKIDAEQCQQPKQPDKKD